MTIRPRLGAWRRSIPFVVLGLAAGLGRAEDDGFFEPSPFVQATAAFEQGDLARAEELAAPLAVGDDATAEACSLLGQIRLQQKRPADAVAAFERAVARSPDSAPLRSRLGGALLTVAESGVADARAALLARARGELDRAAQLDAGCVDAQFELLRFHLLAGDDPAAAERHAVRAVELDPLSFSYDVAVLTEQHARFDLAERYYAQTDRQFPGNPWLEMKHATMLARLGRTAEARARLEATLRRVPGFKPASDALSRLPTP